MQRHFLTPLNLTIFAAAALAFLSHTASAKPNGAPVPQSIPASSPGEDPVIEESPAPPAPDAEAPDELAGPVNNTGMRTFATALGSFGIGVILIAGFLTIRRHHRRPRVFPLTEFRSRFSAPHSGGSDAMVTWKEPPGKAAP